MSGVNQNCVGNRCVCTTHNCSYEDLVWGDQMEGDLGLESRGSVRTTKRMSEILITMSQKTEIGQGWSKRRVTREGESLDCFFPFLLLFSGSSCNPFYAPNNEGAQPVRQTTATREQEIKNDQAIEPNRARVAGSEGELKERRQRSGRWTEVRIYRNS